MIPDVSTMCMLQKTDNMEKTAAVYDTTVEINLQYLVWKQGNLLCFYGKVHNFYLFIYFFVRGTALR